MLVADGSRRIAGFHRGRPSLPRGLGGGRRAAFHEHDEEDDGGGEAEDPAEVIEGFFAGAGVVVAGAAAGSVVSHVVGVVDALVVGFHAFVVVGPSGA